jgi:hypothetical protein
LAVVVVAGQHDQLHVEGVQRLHGLDAGAADGIGDGDDAQGLAGAPHHHHGLAVGLEAGERGLDLWPAHPALLGEAMTSDADLLAADRTFDALAVGRGDVGDRQELAGVGLGDGVGEGMGRGGLEAGGTRQHVLLRHRPHRLDVGEARLALGESAGLVERDHADVAGVLEVNPTLDQDAAAGGGGETADHAHWRRDHERAGASDDQEDQRLVQPGAEWVVGDDGGADRNGEQAAGV